MTIEGRVFRVLFLCTGNSARSQMAEAVLQRKGGGRFMAASAGSHPAIRVHPLAIAALADVGIDWRGKVPRTFDGLERESWDFVITVCDRAKEACPFFPGHPVHAHWGMPDPAEAEGSEAQRHRVFTDALLTISRRIDLFLALPISSLEQRALEDRVRAIGTDRTAGPA